MGAQTSKPEVTSDKELLQRLGELQVRNDDKRHDSANEKRGLMIRREAEGLPVQVLQSWQSSFLKDPKNRLALTALSTADPRTVLNSTTTTLADPQIFNVQIPLEGGPITNQRSSGRCWLFASTNVFRVALMKRYNLSSFELSQSYLFFWDKLEKSNWFLEQIIDTAGEDLDSRLVQHLLGDIISDGGQWDMVFNLVEKYGLVPQALFPDSWNAQNSGVLNSILKTKLREFALTLRGLVAASAGASAIADAKAEMMRSVLGVLTLSLGAPPDPRAEFTWTYQDKDGKAKELRATPKAFSRDIYSSEMRVTSATVAGMVSLVNDPRHDELTLMTVSRLGNIVGGRDVTYVNVGISALKKACVAMLRAGHPIFFGSDVGKFSNSRSGVMDLGLIDYELGFNVSLLEMSKADRLRARESAMTHAMVLTAVHVDEASGEPVRWRVQNSWGEAAGDKGWFVMSDAWLDEFVYQAVIDPRFLTKEIKEVLKTEPIVLPLWDPMGSLA
ncbi:peptidase C1-like family protein [Plectosphaerella cucumerina]|uniref:Cysteine proteinase 1, mitochondrial n=1 Tax=Plectosphaerella cucumerina TaxID=40658 RepID=A0A8K0TAD1_9PEZI|nr:peptidase C1-like family protein [Plectosphaerella cucumerina]